MSFHDFPEPPPQFYIVALKSGGFGSFNVYDEIRINLDSYFNGVNNPQIVYNITWGANTLVLDRDLGPGVQDTYEDSNFLAEVLIDKDNRKLFYFRGKTDNFTQVFNVECDGYHNSDNGDLTIDMQTINRSDGDLVSFFVDEVIRDGVRLNADVTALVDVNVVFMYRVSGGSWISIDKGVVSSSGVVSHVLSGLVALQEYEFKVFVDEVIYEY